MERKGDRVAELGPGDVIGKPGVVKHPLRNAVVATSPLKAR